MPVVALRPVGDAYLDALFDQMRDPESAWMAAFTADDRAASDNAGSLRVLHKAGFTVIGTETSFAPGRGGEIEESVLRLD